RPGGRAMDGGCHFFCCGTLPFQVSLSLRNAVTVPSAFCREVAWYQTATAQATFRYDLKRRDYKLAVDIRISGCIVAQPK
ncbi:MAG: hypothetical protein ACXV7C_13405, partial [Candidatus Angelobacter sp.]